MWWMFLFGFVSGAILVIGAVTAWCLFVWAKSLEDRREHTTGMTARRNAVTGE